MNCDELKDSLTSSQIARLKPLEKMGEGSTACVYTTPNPTRLVKLTTDPEDVYALARVTGSPAVPTIDAIHHLRNAEGAPRDLWAVEVERVQTIPPKTPLAEHLSVFNDAVVWDDTHLTVKGDSKRYRVPQETKNRAKRGCEKNVVFRSYSPQQVAACEDTVKEAFKVYEELGRRGVAFADSHYGNWGLKNGKLVAIDLGLSNAPPVELPFLAGIGRNKMRRRRRRQYHLSAAEMMPPEKKDNTGMWIGIALAVGAAVWFAKSSYTVTKP